MPSMARRRLLAAAIRPDSAPEPAAEPATEAAAAPAALTTAGGEAAADGGDSGVERDSREPGEARLIVTLEGEDTAIVNGGRIALGDGVAAELFMDPFPPDRLRGVLDVYLEQDAQPVSDGSVYVQYDMLAMVHGPFEGSAEPIGGGHFLVRLDYIMFGAWDQLLTIRAGEQRISLPLIVIAKP